MDEAEVEDSRGYRQQQVLSLFMQIQIHCIRLSDPDFPGSVVSKNPVQVLKIQHPGIAEAGSRLPVC
jgi:hypothetical protein